MITNKSISTKFDLGGYKFLVVFRPLPIHVRGAGQEKRRIIRNWYFGRPRFVKPPCNVESCKWGKNNSPYDWRFDLGFIGASRYRKMDGFIRS